LPRSVQEHLGQLLRAHLFEQGEKPQYLGDPMIPRTFDVLLEKIEDGERARRMARIEQVGRQAVAAALMDFADRQQAVRVER
jgi:hypothetical protein